MDRTLLKEYYLDKKMSAGDIAKDLSTSEKKVRYWLKKHGIPVRSISDAIYRKKNPQGDPFSFSKPNTIKESILYGMGMGLYWGEGTKADEYAVRLGNSDPLLVKTFIKFLIKFYNIKKDDLRFGLQIFSDSPTKETEQWWQQQVGFKSNQMYKTLVTKSKNTGTYRYKAIKGVLTVYFNNIKMTKHLKERLNDFKKDV